MKLRFPCAPRIWMNILSLDKYFVLCKSDESSSLFSVFVRAKIVSSSIRYFSINASGRFGEKAEERKEAGSTNRLVPRLMRPVALTRSVYTKSKVTGKWIDQRSNILEGRRALLLSPTTGRLFGFHYRRDAPKEHDPKVPITVCTHRPHTLYNLTAGCGSTPIRVFE